MIGGSATLTYGWRNLARNVRRTLLSVIGVGIGCAMALLALAWMSGAINAQVRAIAESGYGHLMAVNHTWPETRETTLRLAAARTVMDALAGNDKIAAFAPRARSNGLAAFGNRTVAVQVLGIDPRSEPAVNRILRKGKIEGRMLMPEETGAVVIGKTLAGRLQVELEDDLYVTLSGKDDITSAMLRIVGILDTGSRDIDLTIFHVTLSCFESMTGLHGPGEIIVLLKDADDTNAVAEALNAAIHPEDVVVTWRLVHPALADGMEGDRAFMRLVSGIVIFLVVLGIASAQLTAVMERRHEFAILHALGMKGGNLFLLVLAESTAIGVGGAGVALLLGGGAAWYLATEGIDIAYLMGEEIAFGDILLDPVIHGDFGLWLIGYALALSVTATFLATLYPAWKAARIAPADGLRE